MTTTAENTPATLDFGVGGMTFNIGSFRLGGIGLAAVTGVLLNLFLPRAVHVHKKVKSE